MWSEVYNFNFILKLKNIKYFFFDIEDTILFANEFYNILSIKKYWLELFKMCGNRSISKVMHIGKNLKRTLCDTKIPYIINYLKNQRCHVYALTSGYPSAIKESRLLKLKIHFDDIIWTSSADKGPKLVEFLTKNDINDDIYFIDNDKDKLENVYNAYKDKYGNTDKLHLFLYINKTSLQNKFIPLPIFIRYWSKVLRLVDMLN